MLSRQVSPAAITSEAKEEARKMHGSKDPPLQRASWERGTGARQGREVRPKKGLKCYAERNAGGDGAGDL